MPKVESKLEKLISNFESQHNKPFLYDGRPLMDIISLYWDNRRIEKENEKEVRVSMQCIEHFFISSKSLYIYNNVF